MSFNRPYPPTTAAAGQSSFVIPVNQQQHSPLLSTGTAFSSPNLSLPGAFSTPTPSSSSSSTKSYRHSALLEGGNYNNYLQENHHHLHSNSNLNLNLNPHTSHSHSHSNSHSHRQTRSVQLSMLPTTSTSSERGGGISGGGRGGSSTDSHGKSITTLSSAPSTYSVVLTRPRNDNQ